jgi:hypothetical protein
MAPLVSVVDDDVSVRRSLDRLIRSVSLEVSVFASAEEFLDSDPPLRGGLSHLRRAPARDERSRTPSPAAGPPVPRTGYLHYGPRVGRPGQVRSGLGLDGGLLDQAI